MLAYADFLEAHPHSAHAPDARARLGALEQAKRAQQEQRDFAEAQKFRSIDLLSQYLDNYPNGQFVDQARTLKKEVREELRRQEEDQLAEENRRNEQVRLAEEERQRQAAKKAQQRANEYREMYKLFFADGQISDQERRMLQTRQRDARLTDEQVAAIEREVEAQWRAEKKQKEDEAQQLQLTEAQQHEAEEAQKRQAQAAANRQAEEEKAEEAEKIRQALLAEAQQREAEEKKAAEEAVWQAAQNAGSEAAYFDYTRQYPYGRYVNEANDQIRRIRAERDAVAAQRRREEAEHRFAQAKAQADVGLLRDFAHRYPESPLVPEAERLIAELEVVRGDTNNGDNAKGPEPQTQLEPAKPSVPQKIPSTTPVRPGSDKRWLYALAGVVVLGLVVFGLRYWLRDKNPQQTGTAQVVQPDLGKVTKEVYQDTTGPAPDPKPILQEKPKVEEKKATPPAELAADEVTYQKLGDQPTLADLRAFLKKHPKSRLAAKVRGRMAKLAEREYEAAISEAKKQEALYEYDNAVIFYKKAEALKPKDSYATSRLAKLCAMGHC